MIEVPTGAPTIGNVRELPAPCLAAGVQYRAATVVLDGLAVGSYYLAGASQSGTSHLINGSPRQDAYDFVLTADGRLIVAIADGLGSRPASQVGARLFCEHVVAAGATKPDGSARDYLVAAAARAGAVAESAYALTYDDISFVAAVAVFGSEECELARIGDVSGFSCHANGVFEELFIADGGSLNVVAASLPGTNTPTPEINKTLFNGPVVLVTDGLANDIRTSARLRVWLGEQWRMPLSAHAMAESLRYRRQGSHDDRTAVVVWPKSLVVTDS
jgi:serine/threonine protein phosphatase PrpC